MANLSNKTALVTGASRGIGRATALALAEANARVIVHYGQSTAEANTVVGEIRSAGGQADAVQADLGTPDGATTLARRVRGLVEKQLDILVSNADVSKAGAFEDFKFEDFDRLFTINVRSPFFLVQQTLPVLAEGASIVLVSSGLARMVPGNPGQADTPALSAYAATKGAVETLVRHWAAAFGARRIRVTRVENFPRQHSTNCTTKHQSINRMFKPMVRIFKNLRTRLVSDGALAADCAPSYYIEGLLYNAPASCYSGSYGDSFCAIINWFESLTPAEKQSLVCANEQYYLLRDFSLVCWSPAKCEAFTAACSTAWVNW